MDKKGYSPPLRPVEIDGFSLAMSDEPYYLIIRRGGKEYNYLYFWANRPKSQEKFEQEASIAINDFRMAAMIGSGSKEAYVEEHGECVPQEEIDEAWNEYRGVATAFAHLVGEAVTGG